MSTATLQETEIRTQEFNIRYEFAKPSEINMIYTMQRNGMHVVQAPKDSDMFEGTDCLWRQPSGDFKRGQIKLRIEPKGITDLYTDFSIEIYEPYWGRKFFKNPIVVQERGIKVTRETMVGRDALYHVDFAVYQILGIVYVINSIPLERVVREVHKEWLSRKNLISGIDADGNKMLYEQTPFTSRKHFIGDKAVQIQYRLNKPRPKSNGSWTKEERKAIMYIPPELFTAKAFIIKPCPVLIAPEGFNPREYTN